MNPLISSSVIKLNTIQEYRLFAICFLKRESLLAYFLSFKRQQDYRMHTVTTNAVVPSSPVFPLVWRIIQVIKCLNKPSLCIIQFNILQSILRAIQKLHLACTAKKFPSLYDPQLRLNIQSSDLPVSSFSIIRDADMDCAFVLLNNVSPLLCN